MLKGKILLVGGHGLGLFAARERLAELYPDVEIVTADEALEQGLDVSEFIERRLPIEEKALTITAQPRFDDFTDLHKLMCDSQPVTSRKHKQGGNKWGRKSSRMI